MTISSNRESQSQDTPRVLIVDNSADSLDVLQTALERRGVSTRTTRRPTEGLNLAKDFHPDVILLSLETLSPSDASGGRDSTPPTGGEESPPDTSDASSPGVNVTRKNFDDAAKRENAPLILVARTKTDPSAKGSPHVVSKPYHYAPLVRKIQELLELGATRRANPKQANPEQTDQRRAA